MDMSPFEDLESAAARLEASGAYRVLRRLEPRRADPELRPPGSRLGVVAGRGDHGHGQRPR